MYPTCCQELGCDGGGGGCYHNLESILCSAVVSLMYFTAGIHTYVHSVALDAMRCVSTLCAAVVGLIGLIVQLIDIDVD